MFLLKIKYKLRQYSKAIGVKRTNFKFNISFELILLLSITTLLSFLLISSIYNSINDIGQYKILDQEDDRLAELVTENERLFKEKDFYESKYYQRLYAREALNLAEPRQELYLVERREDFDYDSTQENLDPIDVSNYRMWWYKLIL